MPHTTARDRDKLRQALLENLGCADSEMEKLLAAISAAVEAQPVISQSR